MVQDKTFGILCKTIRKPDQFIKKKQKTGFECSVFSSWNCTPLLSLVATSEIWRGILPLIFSLFKDMFENLWYNY